MFADAAPATSGQRFWYASWLVRWLLVTCGLALAGSTARAEDRETARIHFQAAQAAEKRGDWTTAIDEYERAYKLAPHPSVLFNLAEDHEKLSRFHKASELLRQYLRDSPNADDRAAVEARIERNRDRPSHVTVAFPRGATLVVDGQPRGEIPIALDLPAGRHHFHVERDADASRDQEIIFEYGDPSQPSFEIEHAPPLHSLAHSCVASLLSLTPSPTARCAHGRPVAHPATTVRFARRTISLRMRSGAPTGSRLSTTP